jgi:small subunit ribosomal protein S8
MVMTDPIADMLTRIRNGLSSRKSLVLMPASKMKVGLAGALQREGYINSFDVTSEEGKPGSTLSIKFKFSADGESAIRRLDRYSRPGCRRYRAVDAIPKVLDGLGTAILSTHKGILSARECRQQNVGGEVLCTVS